MEEIKIYFFQNCIHLLVPKIEKVIPDTTSVYSKLNFRAISNGENSFKTTLFYRFQTENSTTKKM